MCVSTTVRLVQAVLPLLVQILAASAGSATPRRRKNGLLSSARSTEFPEPLSKVDVLETLSVSMNAMYFSLFVHYGFRKCYAARPISP